MTRKDLAWAAFRSLATNQDIKPGRETDAMIAQAMGWPAERQQSGRWVYRRKGYGPWYSLPAWSMSLDIAIRLYAAPPPTVPSNPLDCCLDALRRHWGQSIRQESPDHAEA